MSDELTAIVLTLQGDRATILCPVCGLQHEHLGVTAGQRQRRALACNTYFPAGTNQRLLGYWFTAPTTAPKN
jgi:hypothetical protein